VAVVLYIVLSFIQQKFLSVGQTINRTN